MADRARGEVGGDDAQAALWRRLEFFPTPVWAARAGGQLINEIDPPGPTRRWDAWEPACGAGHMAYGLRDYFRTVRCTDIHDHGGEHLHFVADFLDPAADMYEPVDWIITNPPFAKAAEFVDAGLRRAQRGVAILARTTFLSAASRFSMFFAESHRLHAFAPFFERPAMTLGRWDPKASTATDYAWFVWMKPGAAADMSYLTRRYLSLHAEIWPIAPGTRAKLTRPEDARLFGAKGPAPLFWGPDRG